MARGKYRNTAEARAAREGALSEVEAGRRTIVRLTNENRELRETLAAEREQHGDRIREFGSMLEAGTSPEIERLRALLSEAEESVANAELDAGHKVINFLKSRRDVTSVGDSFWPALADALGVPYRELVRPGGNRYRRRITTKKARGQAETDAFARANGVTMRPNS
jgi:hypothetical protein